jgi:hypothetical protein
MTNEKMESEENGFLGIILLVVVAFSIIAAFGKEKLFNIYGFWQGNGHYLFVDDKGDFDVRYSSIKELRNAKWLKFSNPNRIKILSQRDKEKAVIYMVPDNAFWPDSLRVKLNSGEVFLLNIDEQEKIGFFDSMASYSQNRYFWKILYPDGICRLMFFYAISSILGLILLFGYLKWQQDFNKWVKWTSPFAIWITTFLAIYLVGLTKYAFAGWWDPLFVGKTMVFFIYLTMIAAFIILILILKNTKDKRMQYKSHRLKFVTILFVASDSIGMIFNFQMLFELIFK